MSGFTPARNFRANVGKTFRSLVSCDDLRDEKPCLDFNRSAVVSYSECNADPLRCHSWNVT